MSFFSHSVKIAVAACAIAVAGVAAGPVYAAPSTGSSAGSAVSQEQAFLNDLESGGIDTDRYHTSYLVDAAYAVCSTLEEGYSRYYATETVYYASPWSWSQASAFVDASADNYCPGY